MENQAQQLVGQFHYQAEARKMNHRREAEKAAKAKLRKNPPRKPLPVDDRHPGLVSRQTRRQDDRDIAKYMAGKEKRAQGTAMRHALLQRQAEREKSGFYEGRLSVATALAHKRAGRMHRRVLKDDTAKAGGDNLVRLG